MGRHRRYSLDQELPFSRAARALARHDDPKGRKLRNLVMAREKQLNHPIAIRLQGDERPGLRITLGAIYRYLPELRRPRTEALADLLRQALNEAEARTAQNVLNEVRNRYEPRIQSLEKAAGRARSGNPPSEPPKGTNRTGLDSPGRSS